MYKAGKRALEALFRVSADLLNSVKRSEWLFREVLIDLGFANGSLAQLPSSLIMFDRFPDNFIISIFYFIRYSICPFSFGCQGHFLLHFLLHMAPLL